MAKIKYNSIYKILGILAFYFRYNFTQYWSQDQITKYQFTRLKKLLIEASKTTYYSRIFNEIGFNPNSDFNSLADLSKIPLTDKQKVKDNPSLFINFDYEKYSLPFYTSGSTGSPMKALVHPIHWIIEQAVMFRHWSWGGYRFRDATAMIRSYSPKEGDPLTKYSRPLNTTYFSPFHLTDENMMAYHSIMDALDIRVIRGYPSSVKIFCLFLKRKNLKLSSVKQVLVASEVLSDKDRIIIEDTLGCKVSNHYGLAEQIVMFGDCEHHTHLHNYFEYGYLELLDTDLPNIKKIIGTNLHNKTMPLIRYDTGDLAVVDNSICQCNRNGLVIKNVIGRDDNNIECPNGSEIPTVNFYTMLEDYTEIDSWQILYDDKELSLNYISKDLISHTRIATLRERLNQRLGHTGFEFIIQEVYELQKIAEGKVKTIIRR